MKKQNIEFQTTVNSENLDAIPAKTTLRQKFFDALLTAKNAVIATAGHEPRPGGSRSDFMFYRLF